MSKQKTMVFVDTENVGHSIPYKIPKSVKAYFYIKDKNILPKVYPNCMQKQIKLIDLATRSTKTKNEMDLALVTQLSIAIAKHKKKRKYVVLSNDKGYDYPIYLLKKSYGVQLCRVCCSLEEYIDPLEGKEESEPKKEKEPLKLESLQEKKMSKHTHASEEIERDPGPEIVSDLQVKRIEGPKKKKAAEKEYCAELFEKCENFEKYREAQKPAQKRRLRKYRKMYRGGSNIWIEFDPYAKVWVPFLSGAPMEEIEPNVNPKIVSANQAKWIRKNEKS